MQTSNLPVSESESCNIGEVDINKFTDMYGGGENKASLGKRIFLIQVDANHKYTFRVDVVMFTFNTLQACGCDSAGGCKVVTSGLQTIQDI